MNELKDLFLWAVSNREEIGFTHISHKLGENILTSVGMKLGDKFIFGRYISQDAVRSMGVAIAETLERVAMVSNGIETSNGLAAHFLEGSARENARRELLERDAFLWAFHWKIKLAEISGHSGFYEIPLRDPSLKGALHITEGEKPVYALAVGSTFDEVVQKTQLDSMAFAKHIFDTNLEPMNLQEFMNVKHYSVLNHAQLSFSPDFKAALGEWPRKGNTIPVRPTLSEPFQYRELQLPMGFQGSGLKIIQATQPELLKYYVGPVNELTNQESYKKLAKVFGEAKLMWPHPFN